MMKNCYFCEAQLKKINEELGSEERSDILYCANSSCEYKFFYFEGSLQVSKAFNNYYLIVSNTDMCFYPTEKESYFRDNESFYLDKSLSDQEVINKFLQFEENLIFR